jgi:DNA-3-methyladenine glycosylase II
VDSHYRFLAKADPVLARLIGEVGEPDPFGWWDDARTGGSNFAAMVLHILGQQISTVVAFVLFDRVRAAAGSVTPANILALGPDRLRECGLSRAKVTYVLDLAERQSTGVLDIEHMTGLDDAEAITALTAVRGIGLWSAQMFLIHQLHRQDVLPAGDVGIRKGVQRAWNLPAVPTVDEVTTRGKAWAPHRTYAAALLWSSLR